MSERGAGSILAVAVLAAVMSLALVLLPLSTALLRRDTAQNVADVSALAAADAAIGLMPGSPCEVASRVAAANGASVQHCRVDETVVTVTVRGDVLGLPIAASATAGPPGSGFG